MPPRKRKALAKVSSNNLPQPQSAAAKTARKAALFNTTLDGEWHVTTSASDEGRGMHYGPEATCEFDMCRQNSAAWQLDPETAVDFSHKQAKAFFWGPDEIKALRAALRDSDDEGEGDLTAKKAKGKTKDDKPAKVSTTQQQQSSQSALSSLSDTIVPAGNLSDFEKILRYNQTFSGDRHRSSTDSCLGPASQCDKPNCKSMSITVQLEAFKVKGALNKTQALARVKKNAKAPSHMIYDGSLHEGLQHGCKNMPCSLRDDFWSQGILRAGTAGKLDTVNSCVEPTYHYTSMAEIHNGSVNVCVEPMCKVATIRKLYGMDSKRTKDKIREIVEKLPSHAFHTKDDDLHRGPADQCNCQHEREMESESESDDVGEVIASDSDDSNTGFYITETTTKVRGKIRRMIDNKGMGVGEFCDAINVSKVSYYRFMKQSGNQGQYSDVYAKAFRFFQKREAKGIKIPSKPTKRKAEASAPGEASTTTKKARTTGTAAAAKEDTAAEFDISGIHLDDEEEDAVVVLDSCDEVRRKINAHMKRPGVTQAQFLRDLHAQFHTADKPKSIQHKTLTDFRGKTGASAGNTSSVYYSAYVYFEKLRLKQKKPKSQHRLEVEERRPEGFDRVTRVWNQGFLVSSAVRGIVEDRLGFFTTY